MGNAVQYTYLCSVPFRVNSNSFCYTLSPSRKVHQALYSKMASVHLASSWPHAYVHAQASLMVGAAQSSEDSGGSNRIGYFPLLGLAVFAAWRAANTDSPGPGPPLVWFLVDASRRVSKAAALASMDGPGPIGPGDLLFAGGLGDLAGCCSNPGGGRRGRC